MRGDPFHRESVRYIGPEVRGGRTRLGAEIQGKLMRARQSGAWRAILRYGEGIGGPEDEESAREDGVERPFVAARPYERGEAHPTPRAL